MADKPIRTNQDFESKSRILNLQTPASDGEPATKAYVDDAVEGLNGKDDVRGAASANINIASAPATVGGVTPANGDRFALYGQTDSAENGIYAWNGAASAMTRTADADTFEKLHAAIVTVAEGTDAGNTFRQTQVNGTLDTDDILWVSFGGGVPDATEATKGKAEIASQAEMDAGTDDSRIGTPLKFKTSTLRANGNKATIGDNASTQFDVTHNKNTEDLLVQVYEASGNKALVDVYARPVDANTVRVNFSSPPASASHIVKLITLPSD